MSATAQTHAARAMAYAFARNVASMQAAYIEWTRGDGADHGMAWIGNTLCGPGLLPDAGSATAQEFFDCEMEKLDKLYPDVTMNPPIPSPDWCASVDAELADTAETDAGLVDSVPSLQRLERNKLLAARYRFAFIESPEWTYAVCKWDGKDWLPINTEEEEYELDQAMLAATPGIKCLTCSGHGLIGGFQGGEAPGCVSEPCPDCNMPVSTLPAAAVAEGAQLDGESLEQGE